MCDDCDAPHGAATTTTDFFKPKNLVKNSIPKLNNK